MEKKLLGPYTYTHAFDRMCINMLTLCNLRPWQCPAITKQLFSLFFLQSEAKLAKLATLSYAQLRAALCA